MFFAQLPVGDVYSNRQPGFRRTPSTRLSGCITSRLASCHHWVDISELRSVSLTPLTVVATFAHALNTFSYIPLTCAAKRAALKVPTEICANSLVCHPQPYAMTAHLVSVLNLISTLFYSRALSDCHCIQLNHIYCYCTQAIPGTFATLPSILENSWTTLSRHMRIPCYHALLLSILKVTVTIVLCSSMVNSRTKH